MRVIADWAVGSIFAGLCGLAGFFGLLSGPAFAQINSTSPVLGIDVYAGNDVNGQTMNWSEIAATGIQFAEVKATQGTGYQDAQLSNNESGATANGIYVGAYDFADPSTVTPTAEASYYVSYAQQLGSFGTGKLLPMLDMENDQGPIDGASSLNAWINAWQADVFSLTGVHPMLYVNPNYINTYGLTPSGTGISSLWLADWDWANPTRPPSNSQMAGRSPPSGSSSPWSTWTFWQYSDYGSVNGDPSSAVDVDGFNGTLAQLVANEVIPALTWNGATNSTWDNATTGSGTGTQNWIYGVAGSTGSKYYDSRALIFQDTKLGGSGNVTNSSINIAASVWPQSLTFTANKVNYTFTGADINGNGTGLTLNGTASVTLNNATSASPNTFTGAIAINQGQLILNQPWATGNSSGATVASGGALVLNYSPTGAVTFGNLASGGGTLPLTLAGAGLTASPAGALESSNGNNTYSGAITLSANTTIESASTGTGDALTLTGGIATGGHTLTFVGPGKTSLTGVTTGAGTVQINSGTLRVTNASEPFGTAGVTLNGGTLSLAAPATIGVHIAADQAGSDGGTTGEQPEQISSSSMAGVVQIKNWNNFVITRFHNGEAYSSTNPPPAQTVPTSSTPFALNDATGAATTAQVTAWTGYNTFSVYNATESVPNAQLVNGFLGSGSGRPATFTFSNVPYSTGYTAYVYFNNNNATAQDAIVSAVSGTYASSSYYVATEGQIAPTTVPYFTDGSASTTAGTYTSSNFVAIPIPALGTQGTLNSLTVSLSNPVGGGTTPGLADIELVANDGAVFSNAVTVSSNSTIDVSGVDSAAMGNLSIGTKTLSVTGGSTGSTSAYNLTLGSVTLTGNATFHVANNSSGSGAAGILELGAIGDGGHNFGMAMTALGEVEFTQPGSYGGPTLVEAGQLLLTNGLGTGNSNGATVSSGAAFVLDNTGTTSITFGNTANGTITIPLTLNGTGVTASPAGALYNLEGNNSYSGSLTIGTTGSAAIGANSNTTLTIAGSTTLPASDTLQFAGGGTVASAGTLNLGNGASIQINSGTVQLNPNAAPTIGTGVTVTVANGATLQLAGAVSALLDPTSGNTANVANNGALSISGGTETVGNISGGGSTEVQSGANLTATQIVQSTITVDNGASITIVPSSTSSDVVQNSSMASPGVSPAIAASGSASADSTNPFKDLESTILSDYRSGNTGNMASDLNSLIAAESQLNLNAIDGSSLLAAYDSLLAQGSSERTLLRRAIVDGSIWSLENPAAVENDSGTSLQLSLGGAASGVSPSPVPEPSTILLASLGILGAYAVRRRMVAGER